MMPEDFIANAPWRFAKTMPHMPHEYTVRGETRDEHFNWFVLYIREHGYRATYRGHYYVYLEVDGWRYWTMGAPVAVTTIINRAEISPVCPGCGSDRVVPIVYGLPEPALEREAQRGEVELGGCVVEPGLPVHRCLECELGFGALHLPESDP